MATIKNMAPQFRVDDLDESVAYYRDRLRFAVDFVYEGISRKERGVLSLDEMKQSAKAFYDLMFNQCKPRDAIESHLHARLRRRRSCRASLSSGVAGCSRLPW